MVGFFNAASLFSNCIDQESRDANKSKDVKKTIGRRGALNRVTCNEILYVLRGMKLKARRFIDLALKIGATDVERGRVPNNDALFMFQVTGLFKGLGHFRIILE